MKWLFFFFVLISATCFAEERQTIYDKNNNRTGYIKDGAVYDKDNNKKGYIKDGYIYDKAWNKKGRIESKQK